MSVKIRLTRPEAMAVFHIAHTNLSNSILELVRPGDNDVLYVTVTSPSAPGASLMYEVRNNGVSELIKKDQFIEGLTRQTTDEPDE